MNTIDTTIEEKLKALYNLQKIDSKIDSISKVRGELPIEVNDLEDEITGLETRHDNISSEIKSMQADVATKKSTIEESTKLIKKYEKQLSNVKNSREYDSLNKELELQKLEILSCEKKIGMAKEEIDHKKKSLSAAKETLQDRTKDLEGKKNELDDIVAENQKEESSLSKESNKAAKLVEERLLNAYKRIRNNARNGLAVVPVERDSCGGCFNKIPPQRQLDIKQRQKIIVCEHCGRILVDAALEEEVVKK